MASPERQPIHVPTDVLLDQSFDGSSLYALRSAVAAHGSDLGLTDQRLADLVLVAHELASNAVRHGGATATTPGRLRLWRDRHLVVCQVTDNGPGLPDPDSAGRHEAPPAASNGRGLWIIRKIVDRLEITSGANGTTLSAIVNLPDDAQ